MRMETGRLLRADVKTRTESLASLVRVGFNPDQAAAQLGFEDIAHDGLVPITMQPEEEGATV